MSVHADAQRILNEVTAESAHRPDSRGKYTILQYSELARRAARRGLIEGIEQGKAIANDESKFELGDPYYAAESKGRDMLAGLGLGWALTADDQDEINRVLHLITLGILKEDN